MALQSLEDGVYSPLDSEILQKLAKGHLFMIQSQWAYRLIWQDISLRDPGSIPGRQRTFSQVFFAYLEGIQWMSSKKSWYLTRKLSMFEN